MKSTKGVCCCPMRTQVPWVVTLSKFTWPKAYFRRITALPSKFVVVVTEAPAGKPVAAVVVAKRAATSGVTR